MCRRANWRRCCRDWASPSDRARQLALWLHRAQALDWETLSDLPRDLRARLAELYDLQGLFPADRLAAEDGTRKFLFRLRDGATSPSMPARWWPLSAHPVRVSPP